MLSAVHLDGSTNAFKYIPFTLLAAGCAWCLAAAAQNRISKPDLPSNRQLLWSSAVCTVAAGLCLVGSSKWHWYLAVSLAAVAGHACYKLAQHVPSAVPMPEQPCFIQFLNAELPMLKKGVKARSPVPVSKAWIACQPIQVVKIPIVSRMVRHWFVVFRLEDPGQCLCYQDTPFHYPYLRVERQAATEGSEAVLTMRFAKYVSATHSNVLNA